MDLESLVAHTAEAVGALITKPKMAPKLLSKPPFRFLHDVISAITQTTGFGEGLMSGEELDSGSITDKAAKIAYLEKVVNFVGVCLVRACRACGASAMHSSARAVLAVQRLFIPNPSALTSSPPPLI